jgi:hypothetical protein
MPDLLLDNDVLRAADGAPLLRGLPAGTGVESDPGGVGVFLRFAAEKPAARHVFPLGGLESVRALHGVPPVRAVLDEGRGRRSRGRGAGRNAVPAGRAGRRRRACCSCR